MTTSLATSVAQRAALRVRYRQARSRLAFHDWLPIVTPVWQWDAPHHLEMQRQLQRVTDGEINRLMIFLPPRHGKALALDTPIPTPSGWTTMGELQVGDQVFDECGKPCNIVGVSPVWANRPVYRVTTDDGDVIIADESHEWRARLCGKHPSFKLHETHVLARKRQKRAMIERQGALQLPEQVLPIDPWVLGLWLGDGTSAHATITVGDEERAFVEAEVKRCGYEITARTTHSTFGITGIQTHLRLHNLIRNKHIPQNYLRASQEQRLALLQGLIDSDGYVAADGQVEFCSNKEKLAWQVHELVCSLGRKASLILGRATMNGKDCGPKYRVMFYMSDAARMPRKRERCRDVVKTPHRYVSAEYAGHADTKCIEVDSDSHLFLAGRSMLPTHNSESITVRYTAWRLEQDPTMPIIIAAYNHTLAQRFSRSIRKIARERITLSTERSAVDEWETPQGGRVRAVGVGGGVTGGGGSLIVVDDPVKSREEADSSTYRDRVWEWYTDDLYTRREPGAAIIICMTRWHLDDLAGRILDSDDGPNWEVVHLPAIALEDDPLGREPGEALWPSRYPVAELDSIHTSIGERGWNALYQGMPQPEGGAVFIRDWWNGKHRYDPREPFTPVARVMFWDTAEEDNDQAAFTVGVVAEMDTGYRLRIVDVVRQRVAFPDLVDLITRTAERHNHDGKLRGVEIEYASSGRQAYQTIKATSPDWLRRLMSRYNPRSSKELRAQSAAAWCQNGMVLLPMPDESVPWLYDFERELYDFPTGKYKDQVDAFSGLVNRCKRELTMGYRQRRQPVNEERAKELAHANEERAKELAHAAD